MIPIFNPPIFVILIHNKIEAMIDLLYAVSAGILGIFAGAQIAEGVLFVPYWKLLEPSKFFQLHKTFGKKIYQFFAPLTIIATLIPIGTAIIAVIQLAKNWEYAALMALFTLGFFSTYFLFFKAANLQFSEASISNKELPKALDKWGKWHWARIYLEIIALVFALLALI